MIVDAMPDLVVIERRSDSRRFVWLLPVWFLVATLLATQWPGNGWQLFSIGAMPGVWLAILLGAGESALSWLLPTLFAGLPLMWFLGRMLDRLGAEIPGWLVTLIAMSGVAGFLLLQSYPEVDDAFARHGGVMPFAVCALQLGSYAATLVMLMLRAFGGVR
ncbi:MAG: hypothetical protein AB8H80_12910 [Planctomycetota bacterium]